MNHPSALLQRLDEIGQSLEKSGHGLALIGLGSVGVETDRLDLFSDLDFFAIVEDGLKAHYIENLDWLSSLCPIAYAFRNTVDGYKLLYEDGIFCEFAVFELPELKNIPFARGRIVWKQPYIPDSIGEPIFTTSPHTQKSVEWQVGEALTNLYVGLGRLHRGEILTAERFIQHYAVDRILELIPQIEVETSIPKDTFSIERRFEQRYPGSTKYLPEFIQGYTRSQESALAILTFLEQNFPINPAMAKAIRQLCQPNSTSSYSSL